MMTTLKIKYKFMHFTLNCLPVILLSSAQKSRLRSIYVTQSGKTGLIAYLKVLRNAGFKYLVCCSLPMVEAMCTKFSHIFRVAQRN